MVAHDSVMADVVLLLDAVACFHHSSYIPATPYFSSRNISCSVLPPVSSVLLTCQLQKKGDYVFEGDDDYFDDGEDEDEEGRRGRGESHHQTTIVHCCWMLLKPSLLI